MRKEYYNYIILFCVGLLLVSCGAQKESLDSSDEEPQVSESQKKEAIEISDEEQKVSNRKMRKLLRFPTKKANMRLLSWNRASMRGSLVSQDLRDITRKNSWRLGTTYWYSTGTSGS